MTVELLRRGAAVVAYEDGTGVDRGLSPRPFLTATTTAGVPVTEVEPDDHLHHLGLSAALPDVNGISFWGGRTFVRERGSRLLDNHGVQRVRERDFADGALTERIEWLDPRAEVLIEEHRTITVREGSGAIDVVWTSELAALSDVGLGSPQTNGRDGAFYGGLFWRAPFGTARVRTLDGEGTEIAHGSTSPWLAVDGADASLVATTSTGMAWFVRAEGYVGFGPAVAVSARRTLAAGETLRLDLAVAILDRVPEDPASVADRLLTGVRDAV